MEQPKSDMGTKKDLMLYRLENAKSDLKSAKNSFYGRRIQSSE